MGCYWWILIAIAAVAFVGFKVWYVPKWLKKQADKKAQREKMMEEED